jgi:hypothetical protein
MVCLTTLVCIDDADFVLCPDCKVVSPVTDGVRSSACQGDATARRGGVGLGVKLQGDMRTVPESPVSPHSH